MTRLPLTVVVFVLLSAAGASPRADAAWTENGIQILSLDEVRARVSGLTADPSLASTTPILVPPGWDATNPLDLRAILSLSGIAIRRETNGETLFAPHGLIDEAAASTRRRPFRATPPSIGAQDAIASGAVILHGEFLESPFFIETADAGVLVNGVHVFPVPGPDVPPPTPTLAQERSHAAREAAFDSYAEKMAAGDPVSARSELVARALEIPEVVSARWDGDRAVILEREDGRQEVLYVGDDLRSPDPPSAQERRDSFEDQAASMRRILLDDRTLLLGATYTLAILELDAPTLRSRLAEIAASNEPEALRLARVQTYTGHRESATDIFLAGREGKR